MEEDGCLEVDTRGKEFCIYLYGSDVFVIWRFFLLSRSYSFGLLWAGISHNRLLLCINILGNHSVVS